MGNRIYQNLIRNDIPSDKIFFLNRIDTLTCEWKYEGTADRKGLISTIGNIKIQERYITDFDIVEEIFVKNTYNLKFPPTYSECIVLDIGMNIGVAALFFAEQNVVKKVYGFEPFLDTYEQAIKNFQFNSSDIQNKIVPYNIALTDENREIKVALSAEESGWRNIYSQDERKEQVPIVCKAAGEVISKILEQNYGMKIVMKMDVEGSEYAIFRSLLKEKCLEKIDIIMMEYHGDSNTIVAILSENGFKVFSIGREKGIGMIYAVK